jgi:fructokinase
VLWDVLPSGPLPGGAPMNVAYHLKKLGTDPALITKIGLDERGKGLVSLMENNNITTEYFQVDYDHPTGLVYARPNEHNEVVYDIVQPVAWDFIQWEAGFEKLLQEADFFVFGSLTSRNKVSRDTLYSLLDRAKTKVLDINLRPPNYHRSAIEYLLGKTDILKVNGAELELVTGWFSHFESMEDRTRLLQDRFRIETIIVTMGGDGALVNDKGAIYRHAGFKIEVADTIGSGDSFLAGFIHQLSKGASIPDALTFASGIGAFIATQPGACPQYETAQIMALINAGTSSKLQTQS